MSRYEVVVEVGPPRGDLYELEQRTTHRVVSSSGETVLTFEGEMSATLSRDSGLWDDYVYTGVSQVQLLPDGDAVLVRYYDGRSEIVVLPATPIDADDGRDDA